MPCAVAHLSRAESISWGVAMVSSALIWNSQRGQRRGRLATAIKVHLGLDVGRLTVGRRTIVAPVNRDDDALDRDTVALRDQLSDVRLVQFDFHLGHGFG